MSPGLISSDEMYFQFKTKYHYLQELDIEEEFLGDEYEAGGSDDVAVTVDDVHDDHGAGDQFFPSHTIAAASHLRNLDFVGVVGETKEERKLRFQLQKFDKGSML